MEAARGCAPTKSVTLQRLLRDFIGKEDAINPSDIVGKDPPLAESPEALALELLHVGLEVIFVLSIGVQVTFPSHQHHQTPCKVDGKHVYD